MRLDIFLPFLRKPKKNTTPRPAHLLTRMARRTLPAKLFADPETGKPGAIRRSLKRIGPTWLSAPARRTVQGICLALFVWLFCSVLWPYTARPAAQHPGWIPVSVDAKASEIVVAREQAGATGLSVGRTVFIVEQDGATSGVAARIAEATPGELSLQLIDEISPNKWDELAFSTGPWTIAESEPGAWPSHYADELADKEIVPAETFLVLDPLLSLSTAIAARSWVWSLICAGIILAVCVLIPRGFCGYLCPLGTVIDLFDWAVGRRVTWLRVPDDGWWVHIKYYLLAGTLVAAAAGVLVSGYVAAIPVITRAMLFLVQPGQSASLRGWHLVPPMNAGHFLSIGLFFLVLGLGLLKPRFWCKYVCPTGAVFSLGNLFRVSERKVESSCINCNKCVEICPFDAIKPDFTTRVTDCTLCQTCGGVCPTHAIKFVERWNKVELKVLNDPPTNETRLGRRGFLSLAAGTAAAVTGGAGMVAATKVWGAKLDDPNTWRPVRPPGSVPEREFLEMCIRCGECFQACPNNVLHAMGFQQGLEGIWTPHVQADWAGCESSCNACGQVCPTGAIRALPLEEKKAARMGLAIVNEATCLPLANREACELCVDDCAAAGYHAIEFTRVHTEVDELGLPIEGTGFVAPVVLPEKCVGCGLCQTRCFGINVAEKGLLSRSAIVVVAGDGMEDRLLRGKTEFPVNAETGFEGSYIERRRREAQERNAETSSDEKPAESYLPDFLK